MDLSDRSPLASPGSSEETWTSGGDPAKGSRSSIWTATPAEVSNGNIQATVDASEHRAGVSTKKSIRKDAMDNGPFGLLGLLRVMKAPNNDLRLLSLGTDLENLGLDMYSTEPLYLTSLLCDTHWENPEGPADGCSGSGLLVKLVDETLFYLFYNVRGFARESVVNELLSRNWCWHKEFRLWLTRTPGSYPSAKTSGSEKGSFTIFDPGKWQKVQWHGWVTYDSLTALPQTASAASPVACPNGDVAHLSGYPYPTDPPGLIALLEPADTAGDHCGLDVPYRSAEHHGPKPPVQACPWGAEFYTAEKRGIKTQRSPDLHQMLQEQPQQQLPDSASRDSFLSTRGLHAPNGLADRNSTVLSRAHKHNKPSCDNSSSVGNGSTSIRDNPFRPASRAEPFVFHAFF